MIIIQMVGCLSAEEISGVRPDATIQQELQALASDLAREVTDADFLNRIVNVKEATKKKPVELIRQMIWFHVNTPGNGTGEMVLFAVTDHGKVSKVHMVEAIAPLLSPGADTKLERACLDVAGIIESAGSAGPDYSYYQNYLNVQTRSKQHIDDGLVEYIFRRSPGQALQAFVMAQHKQPDARKPFLWARHVVDDALWKRQFGFEPAKQPDKAVTEQLEQMAAREEYWARLYAAEIIRQHPEFGTDELVKRLTEDQNPLVQKTAKAIRLPAANSQGGK